MLALILYIRILKYRRESFFPVAVCETSSLWTSDLFMETDEIVYNKRIIFKNGFLSLTYLYLPSKNTTSSEKIRKKIGEKIWKIFEKERSEKKFEKKVIKNSKKNLEKYQKNIRNRKISKKKIRKIWKKSKENFPKKIRGKCPKKLGKNGLDTLRNVLLIAWLKGGKNSCKESSFLRNLK